MKPIRLSLKGDKYNHENVKSTKKNKRKFASKVTKSRRNASNKQTKIKSLKRTYNSCKFPF